MKLKNYIIGSIVAVFALGSAGHVFAATDNASFENGVDTGGAIVVNAGDSTSIQGWTVESGSVDYVGPYWHAEDGIRSVELRANAVGILSQNLATQVGHTYQVTFALAGNPDAEQGVKTVNVAINDTKVADFSFDTTGKTRTDMGWLQKSFEFTATAATSKLSFGSGTDSVFGPAIDNVRVSDVTVDAPTPTPTVEPTVVPTDVPTATPTPEVSPTPVVSDIPEACQGMTFDHVIKGTDKSDVLTGTDQNDLIFAYGGSDTVYGKGGSDCIVGGDGADSLYGDAGNDVLLGEAGADYLDGGSGLNKLFGGEDSNLLHGDHKKETHYENHGDFTFKHIFGGFFHFMFNGAHHK